MATGKGCSDFVLTGCAIVPVMALSFGRPEIALLSHIVLLVTGLLAAGMEDDAPFKQAEACLNESSEHTAQEDRRHTSAQRSLSPLAPLHRRNRKEPKDIGRASSVDRDLR